MAQIHADALLREALALLNVQPIRALRPRAAVRRRELSSRIARYLQSRAGTSVLENHRARVLISGADYIRLDPPGASDTGSWVPAWIHLPPSLSAEWDLTRIEEAIAGLAPMTRDVFLAHRDRDLDYATIAAELGIDVTDVQRRLSAALVALDEAVTGGERDRRS